LCLTDSSQNSQFTAMNMSKIETCLDRQVGDPNPTTQSDLFRWKSELESCKNSSCATNCSVSDRSLSPVPKACYECIERNCLKTVENSS